MIILPPVNQTEQITIFTLYLAVKSKMLKIKQIFLIREILELCGYVIPHPKSGKKRENKITKQLPTNKHFALAKKVVAFDP